MVLKWLPNKFFDTSSIYKYDNIYISGNHLVKENDTWVYVKDSKKGTPVFITAILVLS